MKFLLKSCRVRLAFLIVVLMEMQSIFRMSLSRSFEPELCFRLVGGINKRNHYLKKCYKSQMLL